MLYQINKQVFFCLLVHSWCFEASAKPYFHALSKLNNTYTLLLKEGWHDAVTNNR